MPTFFKKLSQDESSVMATEYGPAAVLIAAAVPVVSTVGGNLAATCNTKAGKP
jgi:Flp pilus assembly pilin Flp